MSDKQLCPGRGWRHSPPCQNYGKHEHDGKLYCKAHHPPTVAAKNAEKERLRKNKFEADEKARAERRQRQDEIERKAAKYDAVVEQRDELLVLLEEAQEIIQASSLGNLLKYWDHRTANVIARVKGERNEPTAN